MTTSTGKLLRLNGSGSKSDFKYCEKLGFPEGKLFELTFRDNFFLKGMLWPIFCIDITSHSDRMCHAYCFGLNLGWKNNTFPK